MGVELGSIPTFGTAEKTLVRERFEEAFPGCRYIAARGDLLDDSRTGRVTGQVALVDELQDSEVRIARWSFSHGKDTPHSNEWRPWGN